MKVLTVCVVAALAVSGVTAAHAAGANQAMVTRDFTDTVAPAQLRAYEAGIKAYNECLREHHFRFSVPVVTHETGNTYQFSYDTGPVTWADMDANDTESAPCDATFDAQANPHLQGETSVFMVEEPELSHLPAGGGKNQDPPAVLHIFNYTLKPGPAANMAFTDAVKKITAAAVKTKWPYYWGTVAIEGGGEGAPDYQLAIGSRNWAGVGEEPDPSLWKMVANAYGQTEADAIRKSLDDSIAKTSDHFDKYNAELSYVAGK